MFDIETRKETDQATLFIVDDIADSFDYRNKYAIVEYLLELSKQDSFYFLILTHNFDFHRTIASRLGLKKEKCLVATKDANAINLRPTPYEYRKNVFAQWIKKMSLDERIFIACIPFVRNLAQYSGQKSVEDSLNNK